jgi:hypothetical protein
LLPKDGFESSFQKKTNFNGYVTLWKDGSEMADARYTLAWGSLANNYEVFPCCMFQWLDLAPTAGNHTYKVRAQDTNNTTSAFGSCRLVAIEL